MSAWVAILSLRFQKADLRCRLFAHFIATLFFSALCMHDLRRGERKGQRSVREGLCASTQVRCMCSNRPPSRKPPSMCYFPSCYRPSGFRRTRPPSPSALGEILCYHERRFPPPCSLGGHGVVVKSVQYMQHRKGLRRVCFCCWSSWVATRYAIQRFLPYETEGNRPGTQLRRCVHAGVCALPCAAAAYLF